MKSKAEEIIITAIEKNSSDIHIEPREEFVQIRFRIDGILFEQKPIAKNLQAQLISTFKIMFDSDIAETRKPQDGKYVFIKNKKYYDLRISILPTIHGEKIVIRILERQKTNLSLEELGFSEQIFEVYKRLIAKNSGIILVTGPTGSGKTTTLYSTLKELNSKEVNIVTIEDPVEYQLPGITQIQINYKTDLTFPKVLRAVLRQDPDIIFVSEIRDFETAKISVQAALTGHLVFATLHAKDSKSAATRLVEFGVEDYLVKDVLLGVVSQRLLRMEFGGRIAIFEVMEGFLPKDNMITLEDEALRLLKNKIVTREEILRVLNFE